MKTSKELRRLAREQLDLNPFSAKWLLLMLVMVVASVVLCASSLVIVGPIFVGGALSLGLAYINLGLVRNGEKPSVAGLFTKGFAKETFWKTVGLYFFEALFVFLWSCLFVVPGIIKAYSYSMSYYILADHPEYTWSEAHKASIEMMKGKKAKLFFLELSFIGWMVLSAITFGILELWVIPYISLAIANFYNENKPQEAAPVVEATAE